MEVIVFLFANVVKICQFKAKDSEVKICSLCLGNNSNDFTINNMKKRVLKGNVQVFSVDYNSIATNNILDI